MKKFWPLAAFVSAVVLSPSVLRAEPKFNGRPPRIYLPGQIKPVEKPVKIGISSEVGFLRDAIYYARNAQSSDGATPAVFATVSIVSLEPGVSLGKSADRTKVWYSYGQLKPSPFPNANLLEGKLPLWSNVGDGSNPFSAGDNMTLGVAVKQNGRTSFHFQIDGRNRLGKGPEEFLPETDTPMLLTTTRDFSGQKSLITISLTKGWIGKPVAPIVENKPIGARYEVSAKFVVTNSDDGTNVFSKDNTVEARGGIYFNAWKYPQHTETMQLLNVYGDFGSGNTIPLQKPFVVERIFSDKQSDRLKIDGNIYDYDASSGNDILWKKSDVLLLGNIMMNGGTRTLKGDGDEESGDLVINVKKIADIF